MSITIVALSDSHAATIDSLPEALRSALRSADIIVHAGDHTEMTLLHELRNLGQVVSVAGNMDSTAIKVQLPHRQLVSVGGRMLGVTHGSGAPHGIAQRVRAAFPGNPDIIIFGHSHVPFNDTVDGVLMVNPGSARTGYAAITVSDELVVQLVPTPSP